MRFNLLLAIALLPLCVYAQNIHPDKTGADLSTALILDFKPNSVLTYAEARDTMYRNIYRDEQGQVTCYYTGSSIFLPLDVDPSSFLYKGGDDDGITCEHIYPQSKGASEDNGNAHSDMHALAPVIWRANEARSNYPFGEVPDEETDHWYLGSEDLRDVPTANLDAYSERLNGGWGNAGLFEPAENVKGEVARAVFYFYTMYKDEADRADPQYFEEMKETLLEWHYGDPVEELELQWSRRKALYQDGKANPFVLDCSLASRMYGEEEIDCELLNSTAQEIFDDSKELILYPNPVMDWLYVTTKAEPSKIEIKDLAGQTVITTKSADGLAISVDTLVSGSYVLNAIFADGSFLLKRFVKL